MKIIQILLCFQFRKIIKIIQTLIKTSMEKLVALLLLNVNLALYFIFLLILLLKRFYFRTNVNYNMLT